MRESAVWSVAAVTGLSAVVLAGCSQTSAGSPVPVAATASAGTSAGSVTTLDFCALVDRDTLTSLGFSPQGRRNDIGGQPGCEWDAPKVGTAGVNVTDRAGINDLDTRGIKVTNGTLSRHPTKTLAGKAGQCQIGIGVTGHSRALVGVTLDTGTTSQACDMTESLAKAVAPKLPSGS